MTLCCRLLCCLLASAVAVPAASGSVHAAATANAPAQSEVARTLDAAEQAWRAGRHGEVRALLEPLTDPLPDEPIARQRLVVMLADATISDPDLEPSEQTDKAAALLERLMDADPTWRMPKAIYAPELYDLYLELREERAIRAGEQCRADLNACRAELSTSQAHLKQLRRDNLELANKLDNARQEQIVLDRVKRVRALALIPFGFGHFYNDRPKLGAAFLTTELALGAAGLGLLINRTILCRRTQGFQAGSLECAARPGLTQERLVGLRRAEEVMGWGFLLAVGVDIIVAQALFRPFETVNVRRAKDVDLDDPDNPKQRRRKGRRGRNRAKVRPSSRFLPGGAAIGVTVRF